MHLSVTTAFHQATATAAFLEEAARGSLGKSLRCQAWLMIELSRVDPVSIEVAYKQEPQASSPARSAVGCYVLCPRFETLS